MANRFTNYGTGRQFAEGLGNIANDIRANTQSQERLAILSAQLKMQKEIADERNKTTIKAAEIAQETQFGVTDKTESGKTDRTEMSITSAEKMNTANITSREDIVNAQLRSERENVITRETGLNNRLSKKLNNDLDMLVKSLASKKELMGMNIQAKIDLLDKEIAGKGFLQDKSNEFAKEMQDDSQAFKMKLQEFTSDELSKRLMIELESQEAIQVMLEGGRNARNKDNFLFNKELQLDKANQQLMLEDQRQRFQSRESAKAFERTKEMQDINFEKQVMGSILELKAEKLGKQQDFNFVASPFSLGKTNNWFGVNYKEDDVLNTVQANIPVLAEAVKIAKDLPKTVETQEAPWYKPWEDDAQTTQLDPRAENLKRVLVNYQKELNKSEFYNWGESSTTKKKAKSALGDVNSLIQMLDMPSSGASFESLLPSNY